MEWRSRPRIIEYWPDGVDYIMGMDESGTADLVSISRKVAAGKEDEIDFTMRDFTLTGVIVDQNRYDELKRVVNEVKFKHWDQGLYRHNGREKRICFHSRDIRKKSYPFNNIDPEILTYDLTNMIESVNAKIISCHIDKLAHYKRYINPIHPYHIAVQFILERYCKGLNDGDMTGVVMLESRGKKEDKFVLDYITHIIDNGTNQNPASHFRNIRGVYFNPKWWKNDDDKSSFIILEYADLVSYPIHKEHRHSTNERAVDPAFSIVERKFYNFPNYLGWGLKVWRPRYK
ncbi:DUF3800 domain-containing protein [Paenibacillus thiaminolyticus]|uniref:DUF3800 domain-containing protein n=1 Tax=Paenibacillus thiaminolyticus TaxID=49283 RepID=A0A3A3GNC0_PANTH|nr:DUF3800 domain-containing protein [Paenibacillus thiaminolyticus]RJG26724.1 DUF3800 domain-containing protein [Paenibacillus thiaminolyticus]